MNKNEQILILEQKELLDIFKDRVFNMEREINVKDSTIKVLHEQLSEARKNIRDLELESQAVQEND